MSPEMGFVFNIFVLEWQCYKVTGERCSDKQVVRSEIRTSLLQI